MKRVIITGTTGMTGKLVLQECLRNDEISEVISISRRTTGIINNKLTEIIHNDFTDYSEITSEFNNIDIAYYCIGVYTGAVSRNEFRKITVKYTKAFADALLAGSPKSTICFLSGSGADRTEKSKMMFARDKGIAENYILSKKSKDVYIFRPGYIYPVTSRVEPNFTYRLTRKLYPVLKLLLPNSVIPSTDLAKAIFTTGLNGANKTTLENKDIIEIISK